ncbi:hypothetical protein MTR67_003102 [Solanum verrucosum]|uniref:Uncharacterized protein n=1 Tax=Solanum verrucosum TaxID=315347 RepID=A0AAF0PRV9_SOLVR|nr:hypothetical protein MTR67_003102 [Solanum verrucosum]
MAAPLSLQEGRSSTKPHLFDSHYYWWWKKCMFDYIMAEDCELWDVICEGPYVLTIEVKDGDVTRVILKTRQQYNDFDKREFEKNHKARKLLMCGIGANEYDLISSCESTKEIWNSLRIVYEGT